MTAPYEQPGRTALRLLPELNEVRTLDLSVDEAKERGIYGFDSRDIRSRSFNLIRSKIVRLHRSKGWRLFGIVSATPAVGKSFIATNLAASLSRSPQLQTYLMDFDLRRGSVSRNFGYPLDEGIRSFLEGDRHTLAEVSFRLADERLIVVPSDRTPARSAELLANERMEQLAEAMRSAPSNSIFICDLPPVFANDDASILTAKLESYIMVVEDGRTTRKEIEDSVKMLGRSRCAGVVLNHANGGLVNDSYNSVKGYGDYYNS